MAEQQQREIHFTVSLDENQIAEEIRWSATDSPSGGDQRCEAVLLSLWDAEQKASLRIDLWTKEMKIDHMNAFFFQTLMTLADTLQNATANQEAADDMREFARGLAQKLEMPAAEES